MSQPEDYTVGIFCPLVVEIMAVQYMLDEIHKKSQSKAVRYVWGKLSGHHVVVATLPFTYRGKVSTAIATAQLQMDFPNLSRLLLVGIGGGVPTQGVDVRLGDVVIGTPNGVHPGVIQYDLGKRYKGKFVRTGYLNPPPEEWIHAIVNMEDEHRMQGDHLAQYITRLQGCLKALSGKPMFVRPPPDTDTLFQPRYEHIEGESTCSECNRDWITQRPKRQDPSKPVIHYGLILSGDSVMKDAETRDRIARDEGGALCFEMEAAAMINSSPWLVIRGICDYADSHKNDVWHEYAAAAAAAVAKEILTYIKPATPRPMKSNGALTTNTASVSAVFTGTFNAQNGKITNINTISVQGNVYFG
ncbi:hypothetical protein ASPCADRAFT_4830 [Aspergillus carbonarius ITEM 5010]|uniref:Nucleoside phosphorylase domain-containing protein n=1 Tax=Aspergillus carbonarius (strain ITEM 5010) TaxID=602072 RepID=A0A1R3RQP7_ASPC5|nr:hypothetical protein ASPCADRAFT_4830 [Aspergillus carbonarius ITEM 5010]